MRTVPRDKGAVWLINDSADGGHDGNLRSMARSILARSARRDRGNLCTERLTKTREHIELRKSALERRLRDLFLRDGEPSRGMRRAGGH